MWMPGTATQLQRIRLMQLGFEGVIPEAVDVATRVQAPSLSLLLLRQGMTPSFLS